MSVVDVPAVSGLPAAAGGGGGGSALEVEVDGASQSTDASLINFADGLITTEPVADEFKLVSNALGSGNFKPTETNQWVEYFEDYIGWASGILYGYPAGIQLLSSGTGSLWAAGDVQSGDKASVAGVAIGATGTTTSGYTAHRGGPLFWADQCDYEIYFKLYYSAAPDATNDYNDAIGIWDDTVVYTGNPNGALFLIDRTVNATNWVARTSNAGSDTDTDTGVAFNTAWKTFRITKDSTSTRFYIDGALVATHTTNEPASDDLRFHSYHVKKAGTTSINRFIDWVGIRYKFTASRGTW